MPSLQVIALTALVACMAVKADGRFPFPDDLSEPLFQLALLPFHAVFVIAFAALLAAPHLIRRWPAAGALLDRLDPARLTAACVLLLLSMTAAVFVMQARKYAAFGYDLDLRIAAGVFGSIAIAWLVLLVRPRPGWTLPLGLAAFAAISLLSMGSFPLHPDRSGMLPLIRAASESLLQGAHPYRLHEVPHPVPLTYLPVAWLGFLPAALLDVDLRWITLACVLGGAVCVHRAAADPHRRALLLCVYLAGPYLLYRHEIYYGPLWLLLGVTCLLAARGRPVAAAVAAGLAVAASQFAWVVAPFLGAYVVKRRGWGVGLAAIAAGLAAAAVPLGAFALTSPEAFLDGVFRHWHGALDVSTLNLTWFVTRVLPVGALPLIQAALMLALWLAFARGERSQRSTWAWAATALLVFVALNPLIWVYFYLTVLWLALCAVDPEGARG